MLDVIMQNVLAFWPATIRVERSTPLANRGGLSGAAIWKVTNDLGHFCLRRWPAEYPSLQQLQWIHDRLLSAASAGCSFIPAPWRTFDGSTIVAHQGHLWELTSWLPGSADFRDRPSVSRLENALCSVAELHQAFAASQPVASGPAPGLERRWHLLQAEDLSVSATHWQRHVEQLLTGDQREWLAEMIALIPQWMEPAKNSVAACRDFQVPLQPCVRDLWHAHILFEKDTVTGIVDFGAMQIDSVCADLTRLIGTMVDSSEPLWRAGLTSYGHLRPLNSNEWHLLAAYDISTTVLSSIQWLHWICDEHRAFDDTTLVSQRLYSLVIRLRENPTSLWNRLHE